MARPTLDQLLSGSFPAGNYERSDCPDLDVVGEAGTGAQAVQLARQARADVVVMDIRMPGMDGIEATQMITAGLRVRADPGRRAHHVRR